MWVASAVLFGLLFTENSGLVTIAGLLWLALYRPGLALSIKRWHDRDKSGWWVLIAFVPLVGPIWALVETGFLEGTKGPNQYGPDPLAGGIADELAA